MLPELATKSAKSALAWAMLARAMPAMLQALPEVLALSEVLGALPQALVAWVPSMACCVRTVGTVAAPASWPSPVDIGTKVSLPPVDTSC